MPEIKHIPVVECNTPHTELGYTYKWYLVKCQKDVDDVCACYNARSESNELEVQIGEFPQWICFEESDKTADVWYKSTYEEYVARTQELDRFLSFSAVCPLCGNADHYPNSDVCSQCDGEVEWPPAKKVEMKLRKILEDGDLAEKLGQSLLDSIETDNERPDRLGHYFAKAYLKRNLDDLLIATCGWSMESLIGFAENPEDEEDEKSA